MKRDWGLFTEPVAFLHTCQVALFLAAVVLRWGGYYWDTWYALLLMILLQQMVGGCKRG